jgi:hypothetical protein
VFEAGKGASQAIFKSLGVVFPAACGVNYRCERLHSQES